METKGIDVLVELAKQLLGLSTGLLAAAIVFMKDIQGRLPDSAKTWLKAAWTAYMTSILGGIWFLMALGGIFFPTDSTTPSKIDFLGPSVRIPSALQIISFGLATVFLTIAVMKGTAAKKEDLPQVTPPNDSDY